MIDHMSVEEWKKKGTITNMTTTVIVNNIKTTKKILVDLDVWNCQIRAFKPEIQVPLRNSDVEQMLFWKVSLLLLC